MIKTATLILLIVFAVVSLIHLIFFALEMVHNLYRYPLWIDWRYFLN